MTPSTDLRRTIQHTLAAQGQPPSPTTDRSETPTSDMRDPTPDPDWAVREIVDVLLFEPIR